MTISYNIGYYSPSLGSSGVVTYHPSSGEYESFQEFADDLREQSGRVFQWCKDRHTIPSSVAFFVSVGDHRFIVRMINVREYRRIWEQNYKKEWTFDRKIKL